MRCLTAVFKSLHLKDLYFQAFIGKLCKPVSGKFFEHLNGCR